MDINQALSVFLPENCLNYFDITDVQTTDEEIEITLTEKNVIPKQNGDVKPVFKGYKAITVSDFPIRGKRGVLRFKRRYWQTPGEHTMLTSDIPLVFPGTKLERAFAHFLKERGGDVADLLGEYSDFIPHSSKNI